VSNAESLEDKKPNSGGGLEVRSRAFFSNLLKSASPYLDVEVATDGVKFGVHVALRPLAR
jgi:hypothetical protein